VGGDDLGGASLSTSSYGGGFGKLRSLVMLLIFFAGLLGAPSFINLRLLGGGAVVGVGARGVCSGAVTDLALFLDFWLSLLMCVLGGTSRSADGTAPTDPG
jgi:hypothetical protein